MMLKFIIAALVLASVYLCFNAFRVAILRERQEAPGERVVAAGVGLVFVFAGVILMQILMAGRVEWPIAFSVAN